MQRPTVSIVIPAYNEEGQLALCLSAVARQTVKPFEVIVVDNNSTDATAAIAQRYSFVTVVRESKQGLVFARTRGYNTARGEIIGRIDADTIIDPDWVERVQNCFARGKTDVLVGAIGFSDVPFPAFFETIELFLRRNLARALAPRKELFLYGGNMALKRTAWYAIRDRICYHPAFHEDQDLAAHFAHTSHILRFEENLKAKVSARRIDTPLRSYYPYVFANSRTFAAHGLKGRIYMYPIEILVTIFHLPLRLLYRAYDPSTGKLSLRRMLQQTDSVRISPVSDIL
jgi:glycosyltransferase involved in cell wall biosynthesis